MTSAGTLLRRLLAALGTVLGVSVLLFLAVSVLPGNAARSAAGLEASAADVARKRAELGLDHPAWQQYLTWLGRAARGDFGTSLFDGRSVSDVLATPLADSALLVAISLVITLSVALPVGIACGLHVGGRLDRVLSTVSVAVVSVPQFVLAGLLALVFGVRLAWLPPVSLVPFGGGPLDAPSILVLPAVSLALFGAAWASRLVRAAVVDADQAPFVDAARLAGLSQRQVLWRHLFPAAAPACAQACGWLVGAMMGGTAVVERVFNYPGLSQTLVDAVVHHDTPVLEAIGVILAAVAVAGLVLADVVTLAVAPQLRRPQRSTQGPRLLRSAV